MFLGSEQLNIFDSFDSFLYYICILCFLLIVDHLRCFLAYLIGVDRQEMCLEHVCAACPSHSLTGSPAFLFLWSQDKAWALNNIFLPLHCSYSVIFMLIVFHLVLIIQQPFPECPPVVCQAPFQGSLVLYL